MVSCPIEHLEVDVQGDRKLRFPGGRCPGADAQSNLPKKNSFPGAGIAFDEGELIGRSYESAGDRLYAPRPERERRTEAFPDAQAGAIADVIVRLEVDKAGRIPVLLFVLACDATENVLGELTAEAGALTFFGTRSKAPKQFNESFKGLVEILPQETNYGRNNKDE